MDTLPTPIPPTHKQVPHYHGDLVRIFLFLSGLLMILGLPFFKEEINIPIYFSIIAVIVLVFLAGLTNPKQIWSAYLDLVVSLVGFAIFEYEAVTGFGKNDDLFFLTNQTIALLFFAALYFSVKTLRGFILRGK